MELSNAELLFIKFLTVLVVFILWDCHHAEVLPMKLLTVLHVNYFMGLSHDVCDCVLPAGLGEPSHQAVKCPAARNFHGRHV
jgi:hypothetical protein